MTQPPTESHFTPKDLRAVTFRMNRGPGYDPKAVDALLDRLEIEFGDRPDVVGAAATATAPAQSGLASEDRSRLAREVADTTIPMAKGSGYQPAQVDGLFQGVQETLLDPSADLGVLRGQLDTARFNMERGSGYDVVAVDELLDHLLDELKGYRAAPPSEFSGDQAFEAEQLAQISLQPRGSRFPKAGFFSSGWQFAAVDELVEQVVFSITVPDNVLASDDIRAATFPTDKSGYRKKDVKAWLVDVEQHLRSRLR